MAFESVKQIREYIRKHGSVFGISSKFAYEWHHDVYEFDNYDDAVQWLHTEEYDFRERELYSREDAINLAGEDALEGADKRANSWKGKLSAF